MNIKLDNKENLITGLRVRMEGVPRAGGPGLALKILNRNLKINWKAV